MQRLGKNVGGYRGESIAIERVLQEIHADALKTGWHSDCFFVANDMCLCAYRRARAPSRKRLYLSTGIHGDEPAGPLAVRELFRRNVWPDTVDVSVVPCLNPLGFAANRRENGRGIDLNRDYRHLQSDEVRAHVEWLQKQPVFDLSVVLHEDWEANGFYLYELNPDNLPSYAERIIQRVSAVCPIDKSNTIDHWPAHAGIIRPRVNPSERAQWPESLFLISHKTRQSYTLEAPSDFALATRISALVAGVSAVVEAI